jgi:hypothetical protein
MIADSTIAKVSNERRISDSELEEFLSNVIERQDLHAKWLNTLSMMEHIGAKKIHSTDLGVDTDEIYLKHASEESRHAYFFKKLARRVDQSLTGDYRPDYLLAPQSARFYFQKLDAMVRRDLARSNTDSIGVKRLCYLYVTKMIEERAEQVYQVYDQLLAEKDQEFRIQSLIREEENHLNEMDTLLTDLDPDFQVRSDRFRSKESKYFRVFFSRLQRSVSPV